MSVVDGVAEPSGRDKASIEEQRAAASPPIRLPYLDGLRAVAATYVVGFHAVLGFAADDLVGPWRALRRAFAFGHEAVAVFIVLSGYCLMLPVARQPQTERRVQLGRFVRRRALRILPPYYAALLLSLALLAAIPALRTAHTGTIWDDSLPGLELGAVSSHLLLAHNWLPRFAYQINGPLWSVASEWQIYFFFPLMLLPLWRRYGMLAPLAASALLGFAPLVLAPNGAKTAIPWYLMLFTLGALAAAIGVTPSGVSQRLREDVPWRPLAWVAWLLCLSGGLGAASFWFAHKPIADTLVGFATAVTLVTLTKRSLAGGGGWALRVLGSRHLVGLGHFSYSLYLTHLPVLALCYFALSPLRLGGPALAITLTTAGAVLSLGVAYAFHVAVERPFIARR
jgi:peptidoglycan/LPS O-acetylase OafA/YrhL